MDIKDLIDSFELIYYEYDKDTKLLKRDNNYDNRHIEDEFFKITYYLCQKKIPFEVLKDKSIRLGTYAFSIKNKLENFKEYIKKRRQNIFVLNGQKIDFAKNIQLFDIQLIYKNIDFSKYDALIFSSKNGILGAENIDKSWRDIPSYVISEQSAKLAKDLGSKLSFVSSSRHGDDFAHELIDELKGKKALYLRASEIVSDMLDILRENGIECDDEVVYENKPKRYYGRKILPKNSKIIFSSPSTIRYFLDVFSWDESYKAISIGKTTAKYFPEHIKPIIADKVSLDSCVKKALSLG